MSCSSWCQFKELLTSILATLKWTQQYSLNPHSSRLFGWYLYNSRSVNKPQLLLSLENPKNHLDGSVKTQRQNWALGGGSGFKTADALRRCKLNIASSTKDSCTKSLLNRTTAQKECVCFYMLKRLNDCQPGVCRLSVTRLFVAVGWKMRNNHI